MIVHNRLCLKPSGEVWLMGLVVSTMEALTKVFGITVTV